MMETTTLQILFETDNQTFDLVVMIYTLLVNYVFHPYDWQTHKSYPYGASEAVSRHRYYFLFHHYKKYQRKTPYLLVDL